MTRRVEAPSTGHTNAAHLVCRASWLEVGGNSPFTVLARAPAIEFTKQRRERTMMSSTQYKSCLEACNACVTACEHCAVSCLHEPDIKTMVRCIELDRDCADMCSLAAQFMSRGSTYAAKFCALCAEICQACGDECAKHKMEHCQQCAKACHKCAQECRTMAQK